jgi:hypothetical protein
MFQLKKWKKGIIHVSLVRKWHQGANGVEDFSNQAVGGGETIYANKFPDLVKAKTGFRVEIIPYHEPGAPAERRSSRGSRLQPRRRG